MLNRIKIVKLFKKKLLSIVYRGEKKIYYQLKFKELTVYKELKKKGEAQ